MCRTMCSYYYLWCLPSPHRSPQGVCVCVCPCMCACVHVCMCACMCACMCVCVGWGVWISIFPKPLPPPTPSHNGGWGIQLIAALGEDRGLGTRLVCVHVCTCMCVCVSFSILSFPQQCRQCDGSNNCVVGTPAQDGSGVTGYDFVLYITADQSECPVAVDGAQTVAFARSCQTEMVQDRPVAGTINFCPDGVQNRDADFAFAVSKHEILHALGFASFLFALWRDPATNQPRTARGVNNGLPPIENGLVRVRGVTSDGV